MTSLFNGMKSPWGDAVKKALFRLSGRPVLGL